MCGDSGQGVVEVGIGWVIAAIYETKIAGAVLCRWPGVAGAFAAGAGGGRLLSGHGCRWSFLAALAVTSSVAGGEAQEACADVGSEELQQSRDCMVQMDIVDDPGPESFNDPILKIQGYPDIIFFCAKCECLPILANKQDQMLNITYLENENHPRQNPKTRPHRRMLKIIPRNKGIEHNMQNPP